MKDGFAVRKYCPNHWRFMTTTNLYYALRVLRRQNQLLHWFIRGFVMPNLKHAGLACASITRTGNNFGLIKHASQYIKCAWLNQTCRTLLSCLLLDHVRLYCRSFAALLLPRPPREWLLVKALLFRLNMWSWHIDMLSGKLVIILPEVAGFGFPEICSYSALWKVVILSFFKMIPEIHPMVSTPFVWRWAWFVERLWELSE